MAVVVNDRVRGQWMKLVSRRLLAPPPRWKFIHRAYVSIFRMNRKRVEWVAIYKPIYYASNVCFKIMDNIDNI